MNRSIIWALAIAAMVGCQKESNTVGSDSGDLVSFSSASIATRTILNGSLTMWERGDKVAISAPEIGYNHVEFEVDDSEFGSNDNSMYADFKATGDPIYKSASIEDVTYSAYYPTSAYEDGIYSMDVAVQTEDYLDFDLLYAETTSSTNSVSFTFNHALSYLKFVVSYNDDSGTLSSQSVKIGDVTTKATYKAKDGSMVIDEQVESGSISMYCGGYMNVNEISYYAIVHSLSYGGKEITFTFNGKEYTATYPDDAALEPGLFYTHEVTVTDTDEVIIGAATITDWSEGDVDVDLSYTTTDVWDGSYAKGFEGIDGAVVPYSDDIDNYYIKTGAQLAYLSLISETSGLKGKSFTLLNDIDLNGLDCRQIGACGYFYGIFNGNDHSITGLYMDSWVNSYSGFFSSTGSDAIIKDLKLEGSVVSTTNSSVGGLVGYNEGTIDNCHFSGEVTGSGVLNNCGGIAGYSSGSITYCSNRASVTGMMFVGGVVGFSIASSVYGCYNEGEITIEDVETATSSNTSSSSSMGGIVGHAQNSNIIASHNSGEVSGYSRYAGGVAGYLNARSSMTSCYGIGTINSEYYYTNSYSKSENTNVGGVIGYWENYEPEGVVSYIFSSDGSALSVLQTLGTSNLSNYGTFDIDTKLISDGDLYGSSLYDCLETGEPGVWETDAVSGLPILIEMSYTYQNDYEE